MARPDVVNHKAVPVTAQFVNDTNNACFEALYDSGDVIKNHAKQFKAKTP